MCSEGKVKVTGKATKMLAIFNCMPIDLELMVSMFLETTHSMEYVNTHFCHLKLDVWHFVHAA